MTEGEVSIDTASLKTGASQRDEHLRSGDFFDSAAQPTATYRLTKFEKHGSGRRCSLMRHSWYT